ncbi:putative 1,3-beta-glucan synthase [Helianthus anomalus]
MDVPSNLEVRRRISFFSNSLFMDMPSAPNVLFSLHDLEVQNEDGVSILFYWQIFSQVCRILSDLREGYKAIKLNEDQIKGEWSLWAQCQAVADMKFTNVVSCQEYGIQKRSGDARA